MEFFEGVRSVRLKSHLGTYLCADDADGVSHGYRLYSRGTVWVVEPVGDDYVRFQGHLGTYLGAADPDAALDVATPSCRVVQGLPSTPNDGAFLWTPTRDGERGCLTLSGPLGRLLRVRFGQTHRDHAITIDFEVEPEESYWVVEPVSAEQAARLRPPSCDGRIEETAASGTASNAFLRFYSAKVNEEKRDSDCLLRSCCSDLSCSCIIPNVFPFVDFSENERTFLRSFLCNFQVIHPI
jgi:hypothetical protein